MSWLTDVEDDDEYSDYDESSARVRPNPKGNRPRTKTRPGHEDAIPGRVLTVDRGRFTVLVGEDTAEERTVLAARARELGRTAIVANDTVELVGDTTGTVGSLARVVRVAERSTLLRRSADDTDAVERVIVANAEQMLIVIAAANPEPRPRLVDRYLVAAFDAGVRPIICVTKTDLADPEPFLANFAGLDLEVFRRGQDDDVTELAAALRGRVTVAVGHSGVGKSTLVNALVPGAHRAIGRVNAVTGRGRHTSSSTVLLRLSGGGWVIDTPGVRSFGLGHVNTDNILRGFDDLARVAAECPRGCTHLPDAPDCELNEAVARGELSADRVDSLQRLLTTLVPEHGATLNR
ncbi:ribosome biogenesis GTPase [Diaminobutyricimonas aerilata]|uniref:Small ribosomal subunit biogenesis GTPase RsgA n=1 Tax=Diaminobutyricimonas aerilata TaxID=1162967 RepID=A0A2M9CLL3_9MICO|nr:ribosome small subunit-dependent GTPase A [Diaminobutyricimonas aerilata]PJJ72794.1 ribosome biogenesis GTPase [Diaminobutyricimonas aerilata]